MSETEEICGTRCGYVAIVGRPNVGKSTLLNHILGQKISITSRKPQTTRHSILGIHTAARAQTIYVDTPGIHKNGAKAINQYMNRAATTALNDVDVIVFLVEGLHWREDDEWVLGKLKNLSKPVLLVINKIDRVKEKNKLLPFIDSLKGQYPFSAIVPASALQNDNLDALTAQIESRLPENDFLFPEEQITDRSERFLAAEIIREKIMRQLGQEVPYSMAVEIEQFTSLRGVCHISALIIVERSSQKAIVIGRQGQRLKKIGQEARGDLEKMLETKVMLKLWTKVKSGWSDNERALQSLGYIDRS